MKDYLAKGFVMGISSLGVGSGILTQDILDQLRGADEAQYVGPVNNRLSAEKSKVAEFDVLDALMDNVYESLKSLTEYGVFESRAVTSSSSSVATVTAADSSDILDFSLDVINLATKQIEQSGGFTAEDATIATGSGTLELTVGSETYSIAYDATTTLKDLKELVNKTAGVSIDATIVQVTSSDFRLMLSAAQTGTGQTISITDLGDGAGNNTLDTALTTGISNVQTAVDASFKFNGLDIVRTSNSVDDLLSGVTIELKDAGTTDVSVKQNRGEIESKINSFVEKYNSALLQLDTDTKSSQEEASRGIFSSDSTIKSMKSSMENILNSVGGGLGLMQDYGLNIEDDGRLSLDSVKLNEKLDENPENVQAFLAGGTFTKSDGSTVKASGIFSEMEDEFAKYSKYGAILDGYKTAMSDRITSLTDQRDVAIERLDAKYAILAKQWAAYDLLISKINAASSSFTQIANSFTDAQNNAN
jgi:flagellar hook-associated protein 2